MKDTFNMRNIVISFLVLTLNIALALGQVPKPNKAQLAWQHAELGLIFHYDLHVFDGEKYSQQENRIAPVHDIHIFQPTNLDVEQWVITAKESGARYAMITATHETGFALYPSKVNPYNTRALGWGNGKEDLVGDFIKACRKHGILPGVYLGIRWNSFLGIHDFKAIGSGQQQQYRQDYYRKMAEGMVKEICTWYGPLFKIWFDGGAGDPKKGAPDVLPIVKKYQPDCLFYHNDELAEARWGGSESGMVPYPCWSTFPYHYTGTGTAAPEGVYADDYALLKSGDPDGKYFMPAMADAPLRGDNNRHEWFWEPDDEDAVYPVEHLLDMYIKSVGRNATLCIGVTPDTSGLVPELDRSRLREFKSEVDRLFSSPLKDSSEEVEVISFDSKRSVSHISLSEDLTNGQLIRGFHIEALVDGQWVRVTSGSSMGNKFFHFFDSPISCTSLKIVINKSINSPKIISFLAYDTTR
ncbi:MAG TPA: alpha-L-fucosidase [Candidatus Sphingobacterium stercoripullorum]|nr:alpha-L-fucosidase [Candidatus Sphingobacterium stercoripullorum]